jgi:RimJ/RimL family protein N-acetyltransferase
VHIELITMTSDEVEFALANISATSFRRYMVAVEAMPPDIIYSLALERLGSGEAWVWCAPRLFLMTTEHCIVGSGCFKNSPRDGTVEVGCGVAEAYRGRNFATEGVHLLVAEGFLLSEVTAITAETAVWNTSSQRVLEKAMFIRTGTRIDPEDGPVVTWRRERSLM